MKNRDKNEDRHRTRQQIANRTEPVDGKDWLGHAVGTGVARLVEMLLDGATMQELLGSGRNTKSSVYACLYSLKRDYGLPIVKDEEGKYKFDREKLSII